MYTVTHGTFRTPRGREVTMAYREDTSDWNTVNAVMGDNDEYQLRGTFIEGFALDVGAHIGAVSIALLVDNPDARVIAVEPVPWNCHLIRENATRNGVDDRLTLVEGSAGPPGKTLSAIRFGYRGDKNLEHHAFIGNTGLAYDTGGDTPHDSLNVDTYGLELLLDNHGIEEAAFLKIDCEGGEWPFFNGVPEDTLRRLVYIIGEAHPVRGHSAKDILPLLSATHDVSLHGPNQDPGPCGFLAVRRVDAANIEFPATDTTGMTLDSVYDVSESQDNAPRGFEAVRK